MDDQEARKLQYQRLKALLQKTPSELISKRTGPKGLTLRYIEWGVALELLFEHFPDFDWAILECRYCETPKPCWIVHGQLTVPLNGLLLRRDGIGYALYKEDTADVDNGVKDAESDAFKRAASKFGIALDLYGKGRTARAIDDAQNQNEEVEFETPGEKALKHKEVLGQIVAAEHKLSLAKYNNWDVLTRRDNARRAHAKDANLSKCSTENLTEYLRHLSNEIQAIPIPPLSEVTSGTKYWEDVGAVFQALKEPLEDLGVTKKDVWDWMRRITGARSTHDISEEEWKEILEDLDRATESESALRSLVKKIQAKDSEEESDAF